MKRTQLLDARRNVRKEIVAYLSIVIIGMLATLSYLGITYSAATLKKDALNFFKDYGLWDIEVASTLGLVEEDLEAIRALPGVEAAESVWQTDTKLRMGGSDTNVTVIGLPEAISLPKLREGRLPETRGECAVEKEIADRCGLSVGQRIDLDDRADPDNDLLCERSFVITGVFQTPDHITFMVPVTPYILVPVESFDREKTNDAFMKIHVRVEGEPENRYSDAYWEAVTPVEDAINAVAEERAVMRGEKMRDRIDSQIEEGKKTLEEAEAQLREGRKELEDSRIRLEDARRTLDQGWDAIHDAKEQLDTAKEQLDRGGQVLMEAEYLISSVPGYVFNALAILHKAEESSGEISLPGALGNARQQYEDGMRQYSEGRMLWYSKGEEYLDALALYEKNLKRLEEGEKEYADAQKQFEEGVKQLADGEAQYRDGENRLRSAEKQRDSVPDARWIVINNKGNPGYIYANVNSEKLMSLSMSFSIVFLVVGALVIYATIGRMVEQQRSLIGATKAMGLYNREIFAKYLYFACTASLLGVGFGIIIAWLPLQRTILSSYEKLLTYGAGTRSFLVTDTGLVVAGALMISVVAVYLGCGQLLRMSAIQLMNNATSADGQKREGSSARGSLYFHLILRNMRTDWSRVLVTTVSVAGGCMLMVIGFTLRYGISGVPDRQFGGILTYEAEVFYDAGENADAAGEIEEILDQNGLSHIRVRKAQGVFEIDSTLNTLTLIVAKRGELEGYFALRDINTAAPLDLYESGALVPRRFHEHYGLDVGEKVRVYDPAMNLVELEIADVFENYYGQLFFVSPQAYEEIFGDKPEENCFFVKTDGMPLDTLREKLAVVKGIVRVSDAAAERTMISQFTASLNFVVWLMLFIAAMMACFIVANFTMTYIQRKTRELTIMRINGFTVAECIRYAAIDLIVTTVLGTLLGLALGSYLGHAILMTTETPYIQMIREPAMQTYLCSALITFGFSAITNSYALRRIRHLKLSDIS